MRNFASWIWPVMASCILLAGCSAGNKAQAGTASSPQQEQKAQEDKELQAWGRGERWIRTESTDKMDGHKSILFSALDIDTVVRDPDNPHGLTVSCDNGIRVTLFTGAARDGVRMKLDDAAPTHEKWFAAGRMMGPLSDAAAKETLRRLMKAQTVKLEFTPIGGVPVVETFKMSNLKELVDKDQQYCRL